MSVARLRSSQNWLPKDRLDRNQKVLVRFSGEESKSPVKVLNV